MPNTELYPGRRRQAGAVILTVCFMLLFLLGFIGYALDFGRAFIVKTELQSAVDSCALSAARELDGTGDAIARARSAGLTAGNANGVEFQSSTWADKGQLATSNIMFRDGSFNLTANSLVARYAECQYTQSGLQLWLLRSFAAFFGDGTVFPTSLEVAARGVATRASVQTTCPVPLALEPKVGGTKLNNYGFAIGEWVTLIMEAGGANNGQIGWANLDGSSNAAETVAEMNGYCGTTTDDPLGTPGVQATVVDNWNYRFGIYKNTGDPSIYHQRPDFTGYAYTGANWPTTVDADGREMGNAYDGLTPAGAHATAANFVTKRIAFASCADTGTQVRGSPDSCEGISGASLNSFQKLAAPGMTIGGHRQYGMDRRLVVVPVAWDDGTGFRVKDYACMLMLEPLSIPMTTAKLEFRGLAGAASSPCTTSGLPGGSAGPLAPVLVR